MESNIKEHDLFVTAVESDCHVYEYIEESQEDFRWVFTEHPSNVF